MQRKQNFELITKADLDTLNRLMSTPFILFNCEDIAYLNYSCRSLFEYDFDLSESIDTERFFKDDKFIAEMRKIIDEEKDLRLPTTYINIRDSKKIYIRLEYKAVLYKNNKYILAQVFDITEQLYAQSKLIRSSIVRSLMLELNQSIIKIEDINQIYQLILNNAIKALEKASIGTVFVRDGNLFKVVAQVGFSNEISDFRLKINESFLYRATEGKMNSIKNIRNLDIYSGYYHIKTDQGNECIRSTIVAPIIINGDVYGTLNIDSVEINAFDDDDVQYMEFMKNCIEIAISNFLLYREKTHFAKHDSLTNLYNRSYIEKKFEKCKNYSLANDTFFYFVVFDIDNLKSINDKYGHSEGDKAILRISQELKKITGKHDCLARIGGDEFLGIFYEESKESLRSKIENALNTVKSEIDRLNEVECSFSFGISTFGEDGQSFDELFKIADYKMYNQKNVN